MNVKYPPRENQLQIRLTKVDEGKDSDRKKIMIQILKSGDLKTSLPEKGVGLNTRNRLHEELLPLLSN